MLLERTEIEDESSEEELPTAPLDEEADESVELLAGALLALESVEVGVVWWTGVLSIEDDEVSTPPEVDD
jgi:hypothetical protein